MEIKSLFECLPPVKNDVTPNNDPRDGHWEIREGKEVFIPRVKK